MSLPSQRALVSMVTGAVLVAAYTVYAATAGLIRSADLQKVGVAMLVFIAASIVAMILVMIAFHIAAAIRTTIDTGDRDRSQLDRMLSSWMVEDEMEKLITLKAGRATLIGAGLGFLAMLILLACNVTPALALHVLLWAIMGANIVEGALVIRFHERGIAHG